MAFNITFNEEKNQLLSATRRISFEDVIDCLQAGGLLADIAHPSKGRPNQRIYVVKVGVYAFAVPYVIDVHKEEIFLKTIYPSRALTKRYIQGGESYV